MAELTQARLKQLLNYDPATGVFTWRISRGGRYARIGARAGYINNSNNSGYREIGIDGGYYKASRLACLYMTGHWPANQMDHISTDRLDDRWINLREATQTQNQHNRPTQKNNKAGSKCIRCRKGRWQARITFNGKCRSIGTFSTKEAAQAAYCAEAQRLFGEFSRAT